jgi:long-chain acyl-CoA synthetase
VPTVKDKPEFIHDFLERSAAHSPGRIAVVHGKERRSYAQINAEANRWARWLLDSGVLPGDRIALLCENSVDFIVCFFGILKAGGVAVPLNTDLKSGGLSDLLREVEPKVLIVSPRFKGSLQTIDRELCRIDMIFTDGHRLEDGKSRSNPITEDTQARTAIDLALQIDPRSCGTIIYTSGSAGRPKGVMLSHANIVVNTLSIVEFLRLTSEDVQMVVLPFFYVMGLSLLNTHIAVGGTLVVNNRFAYTAAMLKQMAEEGVTGFSGVPSTYAHLLFRSPLAQYRDRLPRLRYCSQAGGHMPRAIKLNLLDKLPPHTELVIMYGATEASARLTYVPPERLVSKIDSIGVPILGVTIRVASPSGSALGPGLIGELLAKGDNIMLGYYKDPETTRKVLDIHGYHTGDLGYVDEEGFFYVTGRKDEQIKIGGHRVNPFEIEEIIVESGRVLECIILPLRDSLLGYKLAGLIVPIEEAEELTEAVLAHCRKVLPRFKVPSTLFAVEAVPKNSSGKPDRKRSLELLEEMFRKDVLDHA